MGNGGSHRTSNHLLLIKHHLRGGMEFNRTLPLVLWMTVAIEAVNNALKDPSAFISERKGNAGSDTITKIIKLG